MFFESDHELPPLRDVAEAETAELGLGIFLDVRLVRLPRQKCRVCGLRRVCFALLVEDASALLRGRPVCATHAGIR